MLPAASTSAASFRVKAGITARKLIRDASRSAWLLLVYTLVNGLAKEKSMNFFTSFSQCVALFPLYDKGALEDLYGFYGPDCRRKLY